MIRILAVISLACTVVLANFGEGLANTTIPTSAQQGAIDRQIKTQQEINQPKKPEIEIPLYSPKQKTPEGAEGVTFTLKSLRVEGSTVFKADDFKPYYAKLIGNEVSIADIFKVAQDITDLYQKSGYVISFVVVPAQKIKEGEISLLAVEGFVDKVDFEGDLLGKNTLLTDWSTMLTNARPLDKNTLERVMLLLNQLPGVTITPVLQASENTKGASTLTIMMKHDPLSIMAAVNNLGSRYVGPMMNQLEAKFNRPFGLNGAWGVREIATLGQDELRFLEVFGNMMLNSQGTEFRFSASNSVSNPGFTIEVTETQSKSIRGNLEVRHPLMLTQGTTWYVSGEFNAYNTQTHQLQVVSSEERIRAVRIGTNVTHQDSFNAFNYANLKISQGFELLDSTTSQNLPNVLTRGKGRSKFTKVNLEMGRRQPITEQISVFLSMGGQAAGTQLLAGEEFGFGGRQFGRGYDGSEITGDHGLAGIVELSYTTRGYKSIIPTIQLYTFYDVGAVWKVDSDGVDDRKTAASTGIGIRANLFNEVNTFIEVAQPATRLAESRGEKDKKDMQVLFNMSVNF